MAAAAFCHSVGRGKPIVLIHGWLATDKIWSPVVDALRDTYTVYLIRLPGHGGAFADSAPRVSLRRPDELIAAIRDATPAEAAWIGWSLGATLGLMAAQSRRAPPRLICAAMSLRFTAAPDWPGGMPREEFDDFAALFARHPQRAARRFRQLAQRGETKKADDDSLWHTTDDDFNWDELAAGLTLLDSDRRARTLNAPTLFIGGGEDCVVSAHSVRDSARLMNASYEEVAGASHVFCATRPLEFARLVRRFIPA